MQSSVKHRRTPAIRASAARNSVEQSRAISVSESRFPFDESVMSDRPAREEMKMKYLFLLNRVDDALPEPGSPASDQLFVDYGKAVQAMAEAGVLIDCAPLTATSSATTIRVRNGETLITDGPAAELREQVGGYTLIECADLDEAMKWAALIPAARDASVEIRAVVDTGRNS
jgi:hypothetical protein